MYHGPSDRTCWLRNPALDISAFGIEEPLTIPTLTAASTAAGATVATAATTAAKKKVTAPSGRPLLGAIKHWHSCSGTGAQSGFLIEAHREHHFLTNHH